MKLRDLGEFGLIERLTSILGRQLRQDVLIAIGDDAAVWRSKDSFVIGTTDTMVAGVHFVEGTTPWHAVGWKALAANISDVMAMGGEPLFALVTLALPLETDVSVPEAIYQGLKDCSSSYRVTIVGGDIVRSPTPHVSVALWGKAAMRDDEPLIMRRDAASPGDSIAITGMLGDSAGGLRRLQGGYREDDPLVAKHLRPYPKDSAIIARMGIDCAIDVSDGLIQDLGHVCRASGVGALVRASEVPLSPELRAAFPDEALQLACTGGEDYELLFIDESEAVANAIEMHPEEAYVIGEIVEDPEHRVRVMDDTGKEIRFDKSGWDAFKS